MRRATLSTASDLFDAAVHPEREEELAEVGLEVVARPGMAAPDDAGPGALLIERGVAEGKLAVLSAVNCIVEGRASVEAAGVPCPGFGDGVFAEVDGGPGGHPRALRIAGGDGMMARHVVLLRPLRKVLVRPGPEAQEDEPLGPVPIPAEDDPALPTLLAAVYAFSRRQRRRLPDVYLRSVLEPQTGTAPPRDELQRAAADFERRRATLPSGADRAAALQSLLDELARTVLTAAERAFILNPQRSTLELLEPAERDRYLGFAWAHGDYPGGRKDEAPGPNEARADEMFVALTRLRPERRANQGDAAVVRESEFDAAMQARVDAALVDVPGERGQRLNRDASAAYVQMKTAAAADGVTLSINNSHRTAARARASAARAGHPAAIAKFSSHTLGLAVDMNMSHSGLRFAETTTRPFQNVVDMYKSPVHKWIFLRGDTFGWFPYRREPWHWEYNPPGFRDRFRQPPAQTPPAAPSIPTAGAAATRAGTGEGINDPIAPPRTPLAMTGSVGRGGANAAADVAAVQDRLVELRVLEANDAATERPAAPGTVAETALARTVAAIESFQRLLGVPVDGKVEPSSPTRTDLDRAIPNPTAAERATVTTERNAVGQSVSRGLTITGPVGATSTGNAPEDVRAVQRRLVELERLPASHREAPAAGAATPVPQASLGATIRALRAFQADVRFWVQKGAVTGAITPGVVAPGDATATLLDRVSVHGMTVGATRVSFRDHVVSGVTRSESGVMFRGTAAPSAVPLADYRALGLDAGPAAALKYVSTHEGNFDAINTYDRARVSVGFIQFAGGRGLPPYLALLKARQPAKFRDLLQKLGIDVEFTVARGNIAAPRVVVLDPATPAVLRSAAAETAIRDDKKLTAALIVSGRDRDVQLVQIEAAVRDYVRPALASTVSWTRGGAPVALRSLLRTQKGMAALFDRAIQEGVGAARRRFERVIQRLVRNPDPAAPPVTAADLRNREGDILSELERDLQAAADVAARITRSRMALATLLAAAGAAGATVAGLLARPELADARRAVTDARTGLSGVVNVSPAGNATVDATLAAMNTALAAEERRLALTPSPAALADLTAALTAARASLAAAAGPAATAAMFLARIKRIRRSTLDTSLAEVA